MSKKFFEFEARRRKLSRNNKITELKKTYTSPLSLKNENTGSFWDKRFAGSQKYFDHPMAEARLKTIINWFKQLNLKKAKTLDVGCGDGKLEEKFTEANLTLDHLGIDIASQNIKQLKKKHPNYSFIVQNILKKTLPARQFDIIFLLEVLEHIEPRYTLSVLQKIYNSLKKGGYFFISVPMNEGLEDMYPINPNSHMRCYSTELIKAELEITGFTVVKHREFYAFSSWFWLKDILARTVLQGKWQPNNVLVLAQKN